LPAPAATGALGLAVMMVVVIAITRGRVSPSYVPTLAVAIRCGRPHRSHGFGIVAPWRDLDRLAVCCSGWWRCTSAAGPDG
jgi:hypothetical protein